MSETLLEVTTTASAFRSLLAETALADGGDWVHEDVYLRVDEEGAETLVSTGGNTVLSYNTYHPEYFDEIEAGAVDEAAAALNVPRVLEYLSVSADDRFRLSFIGEPDEDLAAQLRVEGALNARVALPQSEAILQKVPMDLPDRFGDDEEFLSPSGSVHSVFVRVQASELDRVIEAVDLDPDANLYPVRVAEDSLDLEVGDPDASRNAVWGGLSAQDVSWSEGVEVEPFTNHFGPGFEPVFSNTLAGDVELQATEGAPMAVVKESGKKTVRHVLSTTAPQ